MKTQKVKQILLGLIVPVLILAAWICACLLYTSDAADE